MRVDSLVEGQLMERAGRAAYRLLRFRWPRARRVCIVCGPGNNGGDGFVLGRFLRQAGLEPVVVYVGDPGRQQGDALNAREQYQLAGCALELFSGSLPDADVIVDALLGVGASRTVQGALADAVVAINAMAAPVLAIDLPTGIDADSGRVLGVAVCATATLSLVGPKRGSVTGPAVDYVGDLYIDDLGISADARQQVATRTELISESGCEAICPTRKKNTHKGQQGRLLAIGGATGMAGALVLAGEAALHTGAGLVRLAMRDNRGDGIARSPELMTTCIDDLARLHSLVRSSDVILLGPGLSTDKRAQHIVGTVLENRQPGQQTVIDADALNCLAVAAADVSGSVLTPHPGEAARLLKCSGEDVQQDRYAAAEAIARQYNCICVLKGAGTIVSDGNLNHVCDRGHPAMASAGTGDVLAGMIASLMGQGLSPANASRLAVLLHAMAGERLARIKGLGLMAGDLCRSVAEEMTGLCACNQ